MKSNNFIMRHLKNAAFKAIIVSALIVMGLQRPVYAQDTEFTRPSWWFGAAAGANFNFYRGSTQELNVDFTPPSAFHDGKGVGIYIAPLVEYHRPDSKLGVMLQVGYDSRRGSFNTVTAPCNCPADLKTDLSYVTIEPSVRFAPFRSAFYLYAGPRLALNVKKSFTYKLGANPAYPTQTLNPVVKGDFSNINNAQISMQIGSGYDIPISLKNKQTQFILSPFVSFQPYFGQTPRTIDTWNVTTLRAGAALKFGHGKKVSRREGNILPIVANEIVDSNIRFSVSAPENIPFERKVREIFPLRNYVFFNLGSTEIPDRYELLKKDEVSNFKEDQLELFTPKNLSGRSKRQMIVYYNVLNILGDRMGKNPSTTIKLIGSSESGPEDGRAMAESIRHYLVNVFGINETRITVEGRYKPKIPSEKPGRTAELELLREGDRRVSIESSSPVLLMEFQSGPDAPLKPVEIFSIQQVPMDSYVFFKVENASRILSSWSLEIKDDSGFVQNFGPFTKDEVGLPGKSILAKRSEGNYKIKMIGPTKSGTVVTKDTLVHLVLWTPPTNVEVLRFSIIYEFDESKAITIYEKYLNDIVTSKIPQSATVIIHGYTDVIGDEIYNQKLSLARANDVKRIIEKKLLKTGRSDVKFEVYGFGEDEKLSLFENKFPEQRFYNRTVVIDIIPLK